MPDRHRLSRSKNGLIISLLLIISRLQQGLVPPSMPRAVLGIPQRNRRKRGHVCGGRPVTRPPRFHTSPRAHRSQLQPTPNASFGRDNADTESLKPAITESLQTRMEKNGTRTAANGVLYPIRAHGPAFRHGFVWKSDDPLLISCVSPAENSPVWKSG